MAAYCCYYFIDYYSVELRTNQTACDFSKMADGQKGFKKPRNWSNRIIKPGGCASRPVFVIGDFRLFVDEFEVINPHFCGVTAYKIVAVT